MPTFEELERKKKREAQLQWQKILAYYMMETYVTQAEARAEAEFRNAYQLAGRFVKSNGLVNRLYERQGNGPSPAELIMALGKDEPSDSPLGELYTAVRQKPPSEEKLQKALARAVVEEPPRMLADAQKERERRTVWEKTHQKEVDGFEVVDAEQVRYQHKLSMKMALFRSVLSPEVYKELEQQIQKGEYTLNAQQLGEEEKEPGRKRDYQTYVKEKRVEPQEKAGKLANAGDVYSAAAYMLAAWEQKDNPEFDEAKADARAMELSGSRAFKAYMKGHPGNLLAAARGSAVEVTHNGVAALDADLSRRDTMLTQARDSLKRMSTGKTPRFHQMLTALDRFVNADTEPTPKEKAGLVKALGEYITTDCAPQSRQFDRECFTAAMSSVKALLPDKDFEKVVEQVNVGRAPKVRTTDFDLVAPVAEKTQEEPTLELTLESKP